MKRLIFGYELPHDIEGTQQKKLKLTLLFLNHLKYNSGCQIHPQIFFNISTDIGSSSEWVLKQVCNSLLNIISAKN